MITELKKIKINENKKNVILVGNSFDLLDIVEIFLYKNYNVITAIDEFDAAGKIEYFKPVCIFIKTGDNINPTIDFMSKNMIAKMNIPVIAFSKENIMPVNEFKLKAAGIWEVIKFPISQQDFLILAQPIIKIKK